MSNSQRFLPTCPTAQWMQRSLRDGPSLSLSKQVVKRADLNSMRFITFAKNGLTNDELLDFKGGGKVFSTEADSWLLQWIKSTDVMGGGGKLVAEDWRASRNSPFLQENKMPAFFFENEVYYFVKGRELEAFSHWRNIFSNTVPTFHAFVLPEEVNVQPSDNISVESIDELASKVRAVICGAYDGEGFVIAY